MATLVAFVLWALAGAFAILVAVLVTPMRLSATLRTTPELAYRIDAQVLGGYAPRLALIDSARPRRPKPKIPKPKRKAKRARRAGGRTVARMGPAGARLFSALLRRVHLEHVTLDVAFGLSDPAETGQLYGCLTPFEYGGTLPQNVSFSMQPDFGQPRFDCALDAAVRVTAAAFLPPVVRFAWQIIGPGR